MDITIRQEAPGDYKEVNQLILFAFQNVGFSDGDEHILVNKLRKSESFIPALSIVGEIQGVIASHILFTSSGIRSGDKVFESLTLAPLSVHPSFQGQGVGKKMILHGLKTAKDLGYTNVNVLGHPDYYPKFGFLPAAKFGISIPMEVPEGAFMMLELSKGSLKGIHGTIQYAKEFGI